MIIGLFEKYFLSSPSLTCLFTKEKILRKNLESLDSFILMFEGSKKKEK